MLVPGHCYSGFRLEERIAETPIASVWRATDIRRGSVRQVRVLSPEAAAYEAAFLADANTQHGLNHPNRIGLLGTVEIDGMVAVVTEHIAGPSLQTWMRIRTRTVAELLTVFQDVVGAVAASHAAGLVHLHLEPSQIWMHTRRGSFVPKVDLAFGAMARAGLRLGRIRAPELALGLPVDGRADLFLLGTVLYELLAGRPPYDEAHTRLHPTIAAASYRSLGEVRTDLPEVIVDLVDRLLASDPADRPQSAADVLQVLAEILDVPAEDEPPVRAPPPPREERVPAAATATPRLTLPPPLLRQEAPPPPRFVHPVAIASMVAVGLLSVAGMLIVTLGG